MNGKAPRYSPSHRAHTPSSSLFPLPSYFFLLQGEGPLSRALQDELKTVEAFDADKADRRWSRYVAENGTPGTATWKAAAAVAAVAAAAGGAASAASAPGGGGGGDGGHKKSSEGGHHAASSSSSSSSSAASSSSSAASAPRAAAGPRVIDDEEEDMTLAAQAAHAPKHSH
jgi:hypothetical protein